MVIEAGGVMGGRPPRGLLSGMTTEVSCLSPSFFRSLKPIPGRKLIAGAVQAIALSDAQQRPSRQQAQTSRRVHGGSCRMSVESGPRRWSGSLRLSGAQARRTLRRDGVTFDIERWKINEAGRSAEV